MKIQKATQTLLALARPLSLRVLNLLRVQELYVCELVRLLGVPQPTLSNTLRLLKAVGLVRVEPRGRWRLYGLGEVPGWVLGLLDEVDFSEDLKRLKEYLARGREVCGVKLETEKEERHGARP